MAIIKADRAPIETVKKLLESGIPYKNIVELTNTSMTEISIIARVLGLQRKRGVKKGTKHGPRKPKVQ